MKTSKFHAASAVLLATASLCSSTAFAQSASSPAFIGPAIGLQVSAVQNKMELSPAASAEFKSDEAVANLIASYGFAMGDQWVGTVGLTLGVSDLKFGSITSGGIGNSIKAKDHYAISFAPGYRLDSESMVYAKVALHQLTADYESTSAGYTTISKAHTGTGLGIGYALALSRNLEVSGEYEVVSYSTGSFTNSESKPKQSALNFAVQYRF